MHSKKSLSTIILYWLMFATAITLVCGIMYVVLQQNLRMGANDPQIQIAEDAASSLKMGNSSEVVTPQQHIDISESLAPYIIVFNDQGKELSSSALLRGKTPVLPSDVFADAKQKGELRFTWQPEEDVRQAVVLVHFAGKPSGFVLAGRSLDEVEEREEHLMSQVFAGWVGSLVVMLVVISGVSYLFKSKK